MKYIATTFFTLLVILAFSNPDESAPKRFESSMIAPDAQVFYVIGDWGRKGKHHQRAVAEAMNTTAKKANPMFIISTGDNFYTFGVKSTKDKLWQKSFENIYDGDAIKNTDWYPVLGNHDNYGNEQAQIDYSKVNPRWKMPSDYFATFFKSNDGSSLVFNFINTEPLVNSSSNKNAAQWQWIDSTLTNTDATWKFAIGHHPVYSSNPTHGDSKTLQDQLKPILEKSNTQLYFCGHDHDLQHQQPKGSKVDYIVSGAGSELRPSASYEHTLFAKSIAGFALVAATKNELTIFFIDENSNVVYQYKRAK
jgi:predicted phosphodiesterase